MNQEKWNKNQESISENRLASEYAEQKEVLFPKGSLVCDIAGGSGFDSLHFLKNGHKVILLDISDIALMKAKKRAESHGYTDQLETVQLVLGEENIPLKDNSIDVIYSRLGLHYFTFDTTVNIFSDLYRIMANKSKAFITVKSPEDDDEFAYLKETAKEIQQGVYDDRGQVKSRFTKDQWEEILKKAGIDQFEVSTYTEDLSNRGDKTKSGKMSFKLYEITFWKGE